MITTEQLLQEIKSMKQELENSLILTANGDVVDISKIPDRLSALYKNVQAMNSDNTAELTQGLEDLLALLDTLSKEIQKKYEDLSHHINLLDV